MAVHPINNASGSVSSTMPNRMKMNNTESAPLIPGSDTFKREAQIARIK